jgi:hypothetical protein
VRGDTKAAILTGTALFLAITVPGLAHADGHLTGYEQNIGDIEGHDICAFLDEENITISRVTSIGVYLMDEDALSADSAGDVINYAVETYCPQHWATLVAIGKAARGGELQL